MFRVWATTDQRLPLSAVAAHARRVEGLGYDGLMVPEAVHDGLLAAGAALSATARLRVATAVLVAFPRSPMAVAMASWDLQEASGGRFELGLGSQVRGNVEGRYSTPWSAPVPRMREYVGALRAIFARWQDGVPLDFRGEHYAFRKMQPFFDPGPLEAGPPPVWLGAVGPAMTALVGEVADGLLTHPTHTSPRWLREVALPRLAKGAARSGAEAASVGVRAGPLVATGRDAAAVAARREWARGLLGFLYSTPAYAPSLALHGWEARGEILREHVRAGRWDALPGVVDDAMLDAFVPSGTLEEIADVLAEAYAGLCREIVFPLPEDPADDDAVATVVARLRGA
ncbi:MAG TPA: TIGR03617 family F420-dependent LLM class oxidoreductase [Myxococcota bacterium]|nr:TIGR03617 family F420-dependent LLM class oxidoreductase [Myxococcota bacterium]